MVLNGLKIVIVNWCRPFDTIECINSLINARIPIGDIFLVDNGSTDDSLVRIREAYPTLDIQRLDENNGFAGGYNHGIKLALQSSATRILILNNDTIVDENTIPSLIASDWDIAVPKIYFHDNPARIWSAGAYWRKFPPMVIMRGYQKIDEPLYNEPIPLEYTTACAILVRREVFEKIGGFDLLFENYHEDYDFSYRVNKAGFTIGYVPTAFVWHKVSRSLGQSSSRFWWYLGRNSVYFYRKDRRFPAWMLYAFLIWVSAREILKLNCRYLPEFWRGVRIGMKQVQHGTSQM